VGRLVARFRGPHAHGRLETAVEGGVLAGVVASGVLLLFCLLVWAFVALGLLYASLFLPASGRGLLRQLAHGEVWVPLKLNACLFVGERALAPGFDPGLILLGLVVQLVYGIVWGVPFGLAAIGRSAPVVILLGLLWGGAMWAVNGYVFFPAMGLRDLAAGPELLIQAIPFGLGLAIPFLRFERKKGVEPRPTRRVVRRRPAWGDAL
jgi:hypothetical protein